MSKDRRSRGFKFVGSTIGYAYMQATGMVNAHVVECFRHAEVQKAREKPSQKPAARTTIRASEASERGESEG